MIERAQEIYPVNKVILAVPDDPLSEPMLEIADSLGIDNFLGSEDNVLERYYDAARFFKLDVIVRVTGDCPLLQPKISSQVLDLLLWRRADYTSNVHPLRSFPQGCDTEAFTFDCLEVAYMTTKDKYDLEHVTPWMQRCEDLVTGCVSQKIDRSQDNWCVDEPNDIRRLEAIINGPKGKKTAARIASGKTIPIKTSTTIH